MWFLRLLASISLLSFAHSSDASPSSHYSRVPATGPQHILHHHHHHRHLLQVLKPCPVNFATANYTVITSQCKGPSYPKDECCSSFTEFACPYADDINDNTTNCAKTMFNYINIYGRYPAGLFANECVSNTSVGLPCPANTTASPPTSTSDGGSALFGLSLMWSISGSFAVAFIGL